MRRSVAGARGGPARDSLRTKVLLVFFAVTVLMVGALVLYVLHEGSVARTVAEDARRIQLYGKEEAGLRKARELLDPELALLLDRLERAVGPLLGLDVRIVDPRDRLRLMVALWNLPLWDAPELRSQIEGAVLVHRPAGTVSPSYFNLRPGLNLEEIQLDREPVQMVEDALDKDDVVLRGGTRLAAPLRLMGADWGGYYLQLRDVQGPQAKIGDYGAGRSLLAVFLLMIPGMVFLFGFTFRLLSRQVLEPVEDLERAARRVSRGDYSQRLSIPPTQDEIARFMVVFNRMLTLLEEYRDEMEEKVREATSEIERKNKELMLGQRLAATGTLASGIAHEINNPLGGMLNVARRLRREDLTPEQRERYVLLLEEGIERIGDIVRKVLAVSPRKMVPARLEVGEILNRTVDLVSHHARRRDAHVETHIEEGLPPLLGESNEVAQIFLNLLINAVDACEEGKGRIDVRAWQEGGHVVVEIEDNGVGMEPEVAERAFDMFFTTKEAGKGTGLGLATVHSLVQGHGGTLELRTAPGEGTRFLVRLPVAGQDATG